MTQSVPPTDRGEMTTYTETRFHARHREQLPDLAALAAKVEQVHADVPAVPAGLSALYEGLAAFTRDLEAHVALENEVLFPQFEPAAPAQ